MCPKISETITCLKVLRDKFLLVKSGRTGSTDTDLIFLFMIYFASWCILVGVLI